MRGDEAVGLDEESDLVLIQPVYLLCYGLYLCPFEKLIHVFMLVPLTGKHFSETTSQKMVQMWKDDGTYTDLDATTVDTYLKVFRDETLMPGGGSVLFTFLSDGSATVSTVT
ncbi:chalcone isomerase [Tanacetum coccineum]